MLTLLSLAVVATARVELEVTPVAKVVTLLTDLQSQVRQEGTAEAATYDTFACFCKDTTNSKVDSIQTGEASVESLTASLTALDATKEDLTATIAQLETDIATLEADLKKATAIREEEHAEFTAVFADVDGAVNALHGAIASIEGSSTKLVEVKAVVQKSMALADALNIKPKNPAAVAAFLQDAPSGEGMDKYHFHSNDIIATLNDLLEKFTTQRTSIQTEEEKAQAAFDKAADGKREEISSSKASLSTREDELATTKADIATQSEQLTETSALLHDDKTYLKDLTGQCETKAREWDQRAQLRSDELTAIATALDIIQGTVVGKAGSTGAGGRSAAESALMQKDNTAEAAEAEEYSDVVLTQTRVVQKHGATEAMKQRNRVISLLKVKGQNLKSATLALLAMKLAADPFAKVKQLIQNLIERLLHESANEATHKGWCDTEIGKAEKDRAYRHEDLQEINADVTSLEARQASLEHEIEELQAQIAELEQFLSDATSNRLQEKADNKNTMSDASEGLQALKQAMVVLKDFYKNAAKAKVSLVQASPVDQDKPEAFSGAYKGNQAQGQGIIGMLETIASDFDRTLERTEAAEKQAHRDFVALDRETKASLSAKRTGLSQASKDLSETKGNLVASLNDLQSNEELLSAALRTLEKLRPACVDTGMSYEERVQRREAEISALKEAICVLDEEDAQVSECSGGKWTAFLQKQM